MGLFGGGVLNNAGQAQGIGSMSNYAANSTPSVPTFKEYMRQHEYWLKYYSAKVAELTELLSILRTNPDIQRAMILMGQIREGE